MDMTWTLGVNIDHVATLREARYRGQSQGEPDPIAAALQCEAAGAHGITAHLREDRRHIQDRDVEGLKKRIGTRLNLEMANTLEMVGIAERVKPHSVCLVPERRQELTTEGGLDVAGQEAAMKELCVRMKAAGVLVSMFIDPDPRQIEASARVGAQYVELHTGTFAERHGSIEGRQHEVARLVAASQLARNVGLRVNAGHGLTVENVVTLQEVPHLEELNIGHHIISRAVTIGLTAAVKEMLAAMAGYRG